MDLHEMFEGWRWQYSRRAEVILMAAAVVGNRTGMSSEPVDFEGLLRSLPLYEGK